MDQYEVERIAEALAVESAALEGRLRELGRTPPAIPAHDAGDILERAEALQSHVAQMRVLVSVASPRVVGMPPAKTASTTPAPSHQADASKLNYTQQALVAKGLPPDTSIVDHAGVRIAVKASQEAPKLTGFSARALKRQAD